MSEFERSAAGTKRAGLLGELTLFVRYNRKWWMVPFVVVLLLFGGLMILSTTAVAPFIYTLF